MIAVSPDEFLLVFILIVFAYLSVEFYWKQKKLNEHIKDVHGSLGLPFLGVAYLFFKPKNNAEYIEVIDSLMLKYPPPMKTRFGPYLFYFTDDPEELEIILRHPRANQKMMHLYKVIEKTFGRGLVTASGETWKKNRRLIEPIFNQALLNNFVPIIVDKSTELVTNFKERAGKGFLNIHPLVIDCALATIFEFLLGINTNDISLDTNAIISRLSKIAYSRLFRWDSQFDVIYKWTAMAREEEKLTRKIHEFIDEEIRKHSLKLRANTDHGQNIVETRVGKTPNKHVLLVDLLLGKGNLTLEQIRSEIVTFLSAEKVYEEIAEVIPFGRNIEHSDLSKLKYLDMVIKETMRLFPVSPFIARTLEDKIKLKTRTLPKGINVVVPLMHIQRNEKFWPDPLKFIPERFTPEECSKRHPYTWLPFSAGPRNCIGMRLALMQMKIVIAMTIRECVIKTDYNSIEEMRLTPNVVYTLINGYNCSTQLR